MCLLALALPFPADALEIDPGARVSGIYSDNIFLAPGNEISDFVVVAAPGVGIFHTAPRVDLQVDYIWEWLWYDDQSTTADFHNGAASLDLDLVENQLILESYASINQAAVDPIAPIPRSTVPLTANRTNVVLLETAPHWIQPIGTTELDARVAFGTVRFDDAVLVDTEYLTSDTTYSGPRNERGLSWSLNHQYIRFEYDENPIVARNQLASVELSYGFGEFSIFGAYGRESPYLDIESDGLDEPVWRAGFRRVAGNDSFEAFYGERSFGETWGLNYTKGLQNGLILVSLTQQPTSTEQILNASRPRPGLAPPVNGQAPLPEVPGVPPDINVPGDGQRFVRTLFNADLSRRLNRNIIGLRVFWDEREDGINLDGSRQPGDSRLIGIAANWRYILGAKTELEIIGSYANRQVKNDLDSNRDDTVVARISLERELGRRTLVSVYYGFQQREGNVNPRSDFTVNQVGINLSRDFGNPSDRRRRR